MRIETCPNQAFLISLGDKFISFSRDFGRSSRRPLT
jgi:hypothetical protein